MEGPTDQEVRAMRDLLIQACKSALTTSIVSDDNMAKNLTGLIAHAAKHPDFIERLPDVIYEAGRTLNERMEAEEVNRDWLIAAKAGAGYAISLMETDRFGRRSKAFDYFRDDVRELGQTKRAR